MNFNFKKLILLILGWLIALPVWGADSVGILNNLNNTVKGTGLDSSKELAFFIGKIIIAILGFLGLLLVVIIIYAGFLWMTAQGDAKKVEKAKDMIKQAVIGLIIIFAAYAIDYFIIWSLASTTRR